MGIDYSLMVADILGVNPEDIFERHKKLRDLKLLKRVQKVMVRYREKIVKNKWIKHRNHTYYEITPKGERYLEYIVSNQDKPK
jgi:predicted transcriptional regulator